MNAPVEAEVSVNEEEQAAAHALAREQAGGSEPLIKVMLTPTTCGVMKFDSGQRLITMTQQGVEVSIPLGPGEAEQLSQELHVSQLAAVEHKGIIIP